MFDLKISEFPRPLRVMIAFFIFVLTVGFFTGIAFVGQTNSTSPSGVVEHYTGNESDEKAMVMKFKKSPREMLTIVHTHVLSLSFIFFFTGVLLAFTSVSKKLMVFLMCEPFVSIILTFGGIYLIWYGYAWMSYIVIFSGSLMTLCYVWSVFLISRELNLKQNQ